MTTLLFMITLILVPVIDWRMVLFDLTFWSKDLNNSDLRNNSEKKHHAPLHFLITPFSWQISH
ncbi:hypothetical protein BpHYR1_029729 [Brachionus plicatilis]|uniref:Uncharacterized protein n=1 Tax=Brachionus plicatilis TaxID=10195 RepID=A0A3M7QQ71_BRAPC|nr:hypothetical protein BpHYR1_029729 [Brachionus plicatilis]